LLVHPIYFIEKRVIGIPLAFAQLGLFWFLNTWYQDGTAMPVLCCNASVTFGIRAIDKQADKGENEDNS
jgi:hypothetical protein